MKINMGKNIRKRREQKHMSQIELAEMLGVTSAAVSSWELDRTSPKMGVIEKMCEIFGCTADDLVYGLPKNEVDYSLSLSNEEILLIEAYRNTDRETQNAVVRQLLQMRAKTGGKNHDENMS